MRTLVTFLFSILLVSITLVGCDVVHYITMKSFQDALSECAEYFEVSDCTLSKYVENSYPGEDPVVRKLIHCTLLNLGAWDDATKVKPHVLGNFFQPASGDTCYINRTQRCVQNIRSDAAVLDQAFGTFQCYFRQYGNLKDSQQFIPNTPLEQVQLNLYTGAFFNPSREILKQYSRGNILDEPHYPAILYIWAVQGGFYNPRSGVSLENLYTQYGLPELVTPQTRQCVRKVMSELCDARDSTKMYQIYRTCLTCLQPLKAKQTQETCVALISGQTSRKEGILAALPPPDSFV